MWGDVSTLGVCVLWAGTVDHGVPHVSREAEVQRCRERSAGTRSRLIYLPVLIHARTGFDATREVRRCSASTSP